MTRIKYKATFAYKLIYVAEIESPIHRGYLKIGDATLSTDKPITQIASNCRELNEAAKERILGFTRTAGLTFRILHTELAVRTIHDENGMPIIEAFRDYQVHDVLKNSHINPVKLGDSTEFYPVNLYTAKKAIEAYKLNRANLSNSDILNYSPFIYREEQLECINKVVTHFKKADRFLLFAKMRYGKTVTTHGIILRSNYQKTIIISHRPVVDANWYEDFQKIFHGTEYIYGSKATGYTVEQLIATGKPFIYFASVQDLRGSAQVSGLIPKNDIIFDTDWDLLVIDEAHEGTTTELGEGTIEAILKGTGKTKRLELSGTPFNIMQDYDEDAIYTWDYVMEQEKKKNWPLEHFGDSNPYEELPELNIYTYSLGDILENKKYISIEDKAFNFRELFRTFTGDMDIDHAPIPRGGNIGDFVNEADVMSFLNLLTKEDAQSLYPFSKKEYVELFKHTLWKVPGVSEAKALKALMLKHPVFGSGRFKIVNVAGDGDEDEKAEEALTKVKNAIKEAGDDYTITLSCSRLTTGVTVREWTGVFMLSGSSSTSASSYLQTIFRVQSPCNINGKIKERAYVFDFAPDRTLKMVTSAVSVSYKHGKTKFSDKDILKKFLNFCPVIGISGSRMQAYSVSNLLQQLKQAYADKVVKSGFDDSHLYNDELLKIEEVDIAKFMELKNAIGKAKGTKPPKEVPLAKNNLTDEEYEEKERLEKKKQREPLSDEEKARIEELRKLRKARYDAISILRGISTKMPLLIYGADVAYDEDITLERFIDLVDETSWNEFMPEGVTKSMFKKFQKYYDEEVFIAAGRKIREATINADLLDPMERTIEIGKLFDTFKNPDRETVLTPWRVVNMHMSNSIGGWDFWDDEYEKPLEKPRFVDRGETTKRVFGKLDSKILEINSKTGLYPLYITFSCYMSKLKALGDDEVSIEKKRELWFQTVSENIFVICKTPMAKTITKRTLLGYFDESFNAHCFDDLINSIANKTKTTRNRVLNKGFWNKGEGKMKFDAVVGNPPFQEETAKKTSKTNGQATRKSIFHHFQLISDEITSGVVSLIYPGGRWIHRSGKGMKEFGYGQINDMKLQQLDFYPDANDIFRDVDIADGISMVFKNKEKRTPGFTYIYHKDGEHISVFMDNPGDELLVLNPNNWPIVKKVSSFMTKNNLNSMNNRVFPRTLFGIESDFVSKNPTLVRELTTDSVIDFEKEIKLFTNNTAGKSGRGTWYIVDKNLIKVNQDKISEWQVVVSSANAGGQKRANQIEVMDNYSAFGRSRVALGSFKTKEEAVNFYNYCETALVKFMFLMTDESLTSLAKKVPDLGDYSSECSLLDFSKDLNSQLYDLFQISKDERLYIEKAIGSEKSE